MGSAASPPDQNRILGGEVTSSAFREVWEQGENLLSLEIPGKSPEGMMEGQQAWAQHFGQVTEQRWQGQERVEGAAAPSLLPNLQNLQNLPNQRQLLSPVHETQVSAPGDTKTAV